MKRNDLFDYMVWRGDLEFTKVPFCDVDNLIFSLFAFIDFSGIVSEDYTDNGITLHDAITKLRCLPAERRYLGAITPEEINPLALVASKTARFKDVRICAYENIIEENEESQFCAVTFILPSGELCVSYSGTDDTLVGWKEDFNMSFLDSTYAQRQSVRYLTGIAQKSSGRRMFVCGHSKGGNLAVWSSASVSEDIRGRIIRVFNNDGPGFNKDFFNGEGFLDIKNKITTYIPQFSVVGAFFEQWEDSKIVKSTSHTIMSHDIFSWKLNGPKIVCVAQRTTKTQRKDKNRNAWIESLEPSQKKEFIDTMYAVLSAGGAKTLSDIKRNSIKHIYAMRKAIKELPPSKQRNIKYVLKSMFNINLGVRITMPLITGINDKWLLR